MSSSKIHQISNSEGIHTIAWLSIILLTFLCSTMIDLFGALIPTISSNYYVGDFTVFWTAAQTDQGIVYDPIYLTEKQAPITGETGLRPFVYPPSFLLFIRALGLVDHWTAFILWSLVGATIFITANRVVLSFNIILLSFFSPAVFICFLTGQSTIIVGGLIISGIVIIPRNQILAGLFIALAATLKPQAVILAPLALVAAGHWKAFVSALVTGSVIGLSCLLLQGVSVWLQWLSALQNFLPIIADIGLPEKGFTPTTLVVWLGLSSPFDHVLKFISAILGIVTVVAVFRRTQSVVTRVIAIVTGGLLCSPYAMNYELAAMQPAVLALMLHKKTHPVGWLAAFMCFSTMGGPFGIILMALFLLFFASSFEKSVDEQSAFDIVGRSRIALRALAK